MDDLRRQLREAAEAHRPDRERMLARIERGIDPSASPHASDPAAGRHRVRRGLLSWPRMTLAGLAATAALAVGGLAVAAIVQRPQTPPAPTPSPSATASTVPPSAAPEALPAPTSGSRPPSAPPRHSASPSPSAPSSSARPTASRPPGSRTEDGPLWADGSVDPHSTDSWAQSNVTFKTREVLTALTVELHVPQTGGVKDTGHWQTPAAADFTVTVREEGGVLVYRWVLKAGRTVPVGQHVFAGQYGHDAGGRDAGGDWYRIDAATAGGRASVWGDFARTS
ncbi:hypothetical protein [Streptomyces sp. NRRL B-24484]|uniref:hypothetical protein n=1 Tax=Streptomyces sp. NRRL B-24484 TaxID=1463833 RepID=UPI0004C0261E|nr:hypothetical protein [Streptomyces sp. NRRL B-24484]